MVTEDVLRKKFEHLRVAGGPILVEFYLVELCAQWYVFARNGHTQIEGTRGSLDSNHGYLTDHCSKLCLVKYWVLLSSSGHQARSVGNLRSVYVRLRPDSAIGPMVSIRSTKTEQTVGLGDIGLFDHSHSVNPKSRLSHTTQGYVGASTVSAQMDHAWLLNTIQRAHAFKRLT